MPAICSEQIAGLFFSIKKRTNRLSRAGKNTVVFLCLLFHARTPCCRSPPLALHFPKYEMEDKLVDNLGIKSFLLSAYRFAKILFLNGIVSERAKKHRLAKGGELSGAILFSKKDQ